MGAQERAEILREAVLTIAEHCPRLAAACYWAGTSAIALEETRHRESFDLDLHSREALIDTRPFLAELQRAFPRLRVIQPPDARGSGFSAVLEVRGHELTVQVFAAFEDVSAEDLVPSTTAPSLHRIGLARYLADKVQCIVERIEARDLVDIRAVVRARPRLQYALNQAVRAQDALLLSERLLRWTDDAIRDDLAAYLDVDADDALAMRDDLLAMLRAMEAGEP